jgi:hypothetical protein
VAVSDSPYLERSSRWMGGTPPPPKNREATLADGVRPCPRPSTAKPGDPVRQVTHQTAAARPPVLPRQRPATCVTGDPVP